MIQYPSISICKKYAVEGPSSLYDESFDINKVVESYRNKTQSLNEQIYFFTHPGIMNLTFPCTTILGGTTPGRPCVFPVTYLFGPMEPYFSNKCFDGYMLNTPQSGCFTKVGNNNSVDHWERTDNFWGYCPKECNGELPVPSSPYNLAKSKYANLWSSHFFDLNAWENGLCHTYDPSVKTEIGKVNHAYFMMSYLTQVSYNDYDIFIHEKGQFWPRAGMTPFGQPNSIREGLKKVVSREFSLASKVGNLFIFFVLIADDKIRFVLKCKNSKL